MRRFAGLLVGVLAILGSGSSAAQSAYPDKPLHIVVGFPTGSQPDIVARLLAQELGEALGQPIVVENVTGAAGNIAAERVAKAAPDGYTLGLLSQTHLVVNPSLYKLPYDPVKDFAPISQVAVSPYMLVVSNTVPVKSVGDLVALAKREPGVLTFASSGTGSGTHIATELFRFSTGADLRHIPYKGVVAAIPDVMSGRVTLMFTPIPVVLDLVNERKLRALAVTSSTRSSAAPTLPTVAESGYPGFEATNWYGLLAPARTPPAVVRRLHSETAKILAQPELRDRFSHMGLETIGNSPEEFAAAIRTELPKWASVIRKSGMKVD